MQEIEELEKQVQVCVGLPGRFVKQIDNMRGLIPRAAYLRDWILKRAREEAKKGVKND